MSIHRLCEVFPWVKRTTSRIAYHIFRRVELYRTVSAGRRSTVAPAGLLGVLRGVPRAALLLLLDGPEAARLVPEGRSRAVSTQRLERQTDGVADTKVAAFPQIRK